MHVTDSARFKPFLTGLAVIAVARRLAPRGFRWRRPPYEFERRRLPIDILLGTDCDPARHRAGGARSARSSGGWQPDLARWRRRRAAALLYGSASGKIAERRDGAPRRRPKGVCGARTGLSINGTGW